MERDAVRFEFGVFEVDLRARELRKRGVRVKLQDQPFTILTLLLEEPGAVVTRDQIKERLWPDKTFVDFESSINGAVRKLRDALNETADNPRFVGTVARKGYRFLAPVRSKFSATDALSPPPPSLPLLKRASIFQRASRWQFVFGVVGIVAACSLLLNLFKWPMRRGAPIEVLPLTSYRGSERRPSFSPDGTRVAFSWNGTDLVHTAIYAKTLDSTDPIRLTQDTNQYDNDPAWSPDGQKIAFIRFLRFSNAIMTVPAMGGHQKEVGRSCGAGSGIPPHLAWSNDGRYLFWSERDRTNKFLLAIVRQDTQTGLTRQISFPPKGVVGDSGLAISPDGNKLVFARALTLTSMDIYTVPLSGDYLPTRAPEKVVSSIEAESIAWTADSRELVFTGLVDDREGIWRVNIAGRRSIRPVSGLPQPAELPKPVALETDRGTDLAISHQGGDLIYTPANSDSNIWRMSLSGSDRGKAAVLISSTRNEFQPDFSPDGRFITFESDRSGFEEIWMSNADGTGTVQLTSFDGGLSSIPRWAPDSHRIAFERLDSGKRAIYVVDTETNKVTAITSRENDNFAPTWSADGRFVYFTSGRTGHDETWKAPGAGGQEIQVTRNGSIFAQESSDGQNLYYARSIPGAFPIFRSKMDGSSEVKVVDTQACFVVVPHGLYFYRPSDSEVVLKFLDFVHGSERTVATMPTTQIGRAHDHLA